MSSWLRESCCSRFKRRRLPARLLRVNSFIVRLDEKAERIPLTIADFDREAGTVTLIIQALGRSTIDMCALRNSGVLDVVGPLGQPSELEGFKQIVCIGGGLGIAPC